MQLLVLILKRVELMNDLLHELVEAGIKGGTILDGHGMGESLVDMEDIPMFGVLRQMLSNDDKESTKLLLFVVKDEQVVPTTQVIKRVVGDLSKPNTGILFSLPIYYCEGLSE
ncbi:MAG: hypothetical protein PUF50_02645 [Erysipelotrichaceae bacterium]|nr:hypothetical protein [Erysipelotrichaceae bacterium]